MSISIYRFSKIILELGPMVLNPTYKFHFLSVFLRLAKLAYLQSITLQPVHPPKRNGHLKNVKWNNF